MQISCEHCKKTLNIPDDKLPDASRFRLRCPHCHNKTLVELKNPQAEDEHIATESAPDISSNSKQVEQDIFPPGAVVAFLYFQDQDWSVEGQQYFQDRQYYVSTAENNEEAVQKLKLNTYELICIEDKTEYKDLWQEIASWPGKQRSRINVIMVGERANSFDPNEAFVRGVDTYLHLTDQNTKEQLLDQAIEGYKLKFEPWNIAEEEEG